MYQHASRTLLTRKGTTIFLVINLLWIISLPVFAQGEGELKTVVLDAGHGGKDPGTHGKASKEKDITLAVILKLGKLIEKHYPKVKVIYTRETDEFIELNRRTEIANENKADLFISIHCNSAAPAARGAETYVMGLHSMKSNLEVAQRENAVITYEDDYSTKYDGYDPKSPESFIIFQLMQNVFLSQSLEFAGSVQSQFTDSLRRFNRGVKQAGFLVLYKSSMPSVLIELGFLTNRKEEKYLLSQKGQRQMANAIFRAFEVYKRNRDQRAAPVAEPIAEATKPIVTDTVYRIQVATLNAPLSKTHRLWKLYPHMKVEHEGKRYRYFSHDFKRKSEARAKVKIVREHCPDAFVVVFTNSHRAR